MQKLLAEYYIDHAGATITPEDNQEFFELIDGLYRALPMKVSIVNYEPYSNLKGITYDIARHGRLKVSSLNNEPYEKLMSCATNLKFRAVHDYHHYMTQGEFNYSGELATFEYIAKLCRSPRMQDIMYSEIVLQACYSLEYGHFPIQKVVLIERSA